jgi:hypothetical protein
MMLVRKAALSGSEQASRFSISSLCARSKLSGPTMYWIKHPDVATRPDGVQDFRSKLFSVHRNIIAGATPIRDRGEIAQMQSRR